MPSSPITGNISRRGMLLASLAVLFAAGCESTAPQKAKDTKEKVTDFDPLRDAPETNETMVRIPVPFSCQAPTGNWKPPFDEACEETCLLMVHQYLVGVKDIDPAEAESEIRAIVDRATKKGHGIDISTGTVGELAKEHYGLTSHVYKGDAVDSVNMKRLLAAGHPIIIPVARLKNRFFKGEAAYHMIVVTGFETGDEGPVFLTNDPGTKQGKGYAYPEGYLLDRIHDWDGSRETVPKAPRAMLVLGK